MDLDEHASNWQRLGRRALREPFGWVFICRAFLYAGGSQRLQFGHFGTVIPAIFRPAGPRKPSPGFSLGLQFGHFQRCITSRIVDILGRGGLNHGGVAKDVGWRALAEGLASICLRRSVTASWQEGRRAALRHLGSGS